MRVSILAAAVGFGLVSSLTLAASPPKTQIGPVRAMLEQSLKDYSRARFMDVRAVTGKGGAGGFCGKVNAPNSMGGYTGYSDFYVDSAIFGTVQSDSLNQKVAFLDNCADSSSIKYRDDVDYSVAISPKTK